MWTYEKKTNYNFRRENQASLPAVKSTRYGLRSFRYEAARIWNCLPNNVRLAESFPQFKRLLHAWNGDICGDKVKCELRVASRELQVASCESQVASWVMKVQILVLKGGPKTS